MQRDFIYKWRCEWMKQWGPIWIKWFMNLLQSFIVNQMIHKPAPKFRYESKYLWYALWSYDLNTNICDTRFEVTIWIQIFVIRALIFRSGYKYLWYALWSFDFNINICDTRFEVLIWIKRFEIRALKFWFESKDLWYKLWSSDLNLNICDTCFEVPIWI